MTTGEGRAFAQMLAVFGEMESSATSSRIAAARDYLLKSGRVAGGVAPYGWLNVANPNGPGKVTVQDPERIGWVRAMVERAQRGDTVYSIQRWLTDQGAPQSYRSTRESDEWLYTTVERVLRHPILAGLTLYNPGVGARSRARQVLCGPDGEPVVRPELAIMTVADHWALVHRLSHKTHGAAKAMNLKATTSPLLSRLAECGACGCSGYMSRAIHHARKAPILRCRKCFQSISVAMLATHLEERLLAQRGALPMFRRVETVAGNSMATLRLQELDDALTRAALALTEDGADVAVLGVRITRLKQARSQARDTAREHLSSGLVELGHTVEDIWRRCTSDLQRRAVLAGQIDRLVINRGVRGCRTFQPHRVEITWRTEHHAAAPVALDLTGPVPPNRMYEVPEWIPLRVAMALTGCTETTIRKAVRDGEIARRHAAASYPSLSGPSVQAFASAYPRRTWRTGTWNASPSFRIAAINR